MTKSSTKKLTVENLRKSGNRVRVSHFRCIKDGPTVLNANTGLPEPKPVPRFEISDPKSILPKGGMVVVDLTTLMGETFTGVAKCNPKDIFRKKKGLDRALGRAIQAATKQSRNLVLA